mmetsp:Transcript_48432/g.128266  ORF Transcript_48432/g.128266 Transcript_48432/m.128266 type:complete len:89 (-) Transcript_48432:1895-2161(-)
MRPRPKGVNTTEKREGDGPTCAAATLSRGAYKGSTKNWDHVAAEVRTHIRREEKAGLSVLKSRNEEFTALETTAKIVRSTESSSKKQR